MAKKFIQETKFVTIEISQFDSIIDVGNKMIKVGETMPDAVKFSFSVVGCDDEQYISCKFTTSRVETDEEYSDRVVTEQTQFNQNDEAWTYGDDMSRLGEDYIPKKVKVIFGPDVNGMYCVLKENGVTDRVGVLFKTKKEIENWIKKESVQSA